MKKEKIEFSCLCFDKDNKCIFGEDPKRFATLLSSNNYLFSKNTNITEIDSIHTVLKDETKNIVVTVSRLVTPDFLDFKTAFYLKTEFTPSDKNIKDFDDFRQTLIKFLVEQKFGKIYITKDELSTTLLSELYLKMNKVENILRSYVTKHFSLTEGVSYWFNNVIDNRVETKTGKRKSNEDVFSTLLDDNDKNGFVVDTRMYVIDFEDLGNIIYTNSFGNLKIEDLVTKIESSTDLDTLKSGVKSNIDRYFQSFKDINFQEKWNYLKSIRNKIAHNSLISFEQKEKANEFLDVLIEFVEKIDAEKIGDSVNVDAFIDIEKREFASSSNSYKEIEKDELLKEIHSYKKWSENIGRNFLGLKNFLYNRLGGMDYHIGKAWEKLEELEKDGEIEIYVWKDPTNTFGDQKAIKILKDRTVWAG